MYNFIDWSTLDLGNKTTGKKSTTCPSCSHTRKKKSDKCLTIYVSEGVAKCFHCDSLSFRDETQLEESYVLPKQNWRNYTDLSDKLVKWLEGTRKIKQSTAIALGWSEEKHYQPQLKKEVQNLVFNFFEGETLVNKKYRSADKKFTQSAGTKSIFYNINSAVGQKEVWITEGEFDTAVLYQEGIKNVISMPQGANDNDSYWIEAEQYLKNVKIFIIAVDNDPKGNELKEKIAQRLGRYRCKFVTWKGKDANDDLISGDLKKSISNLHSFPVSGTFTSKDLRAGVDKLYSEGLPKTIYPKGEWFGDLKNKFSTMRGQVVLPTGIPSHGKSTFTDWYVLNLIKDYKMKASWYTPEHSPMDLYETELIQKTIGRNFWKDVDGQPRITKNDIDDYDSWSNDKIYFTDCGENESPTWSWLLDKFKEQMYSFGIDIFVIDAFNKVILPKGNKIDEINTVLTKLTHFAKANNVIIFLVAHPTKMKKGDDGNYAVPTLYDVSGSSDFRNQVHCGFSIYRHFGDNPKTTFLNLKTKYSFQGTIGASEDFNYCMANGRLISGNISNPYFNLIKPNEKTISKQILLEPNDAFNINEDEIPF